MQVEPSGLVFVAECQVNTDRCIAHDPTAITAVWVPPGRQQVDVCRPCLEEMMRLGQWQVSGARLRQQYDAAVLDRHGKLILVVEVKRQKMSATAPPRWAIEVHRNLLAHAAFGRTHFFMLLLAPDWMFLWGHQNVGAPEAAPDFTVNVTDALRPHLLRQEAVDLPAWQRTEAAVADWIETLLRDGSSEPWFRDSGLAEALAGGHLVTDYAA